MFKSSLPSSSVLRPLPNVRLSLGMGSEARNVSSWVHTVPTSWGDKRRMWPSTARKLSADAVEISCSAVRTLGIKFELSYLLTFILLEVVLGFINVWCLLGCAFGKFCSKNAWSASGCPDILLLFCKSYPKLALCPLLLLLWWLACAWHLELGIQCIKVIEPSLFCFFFLLLFHLRNC